MEAAAHDPLDHATAHLRRGDVAAAVRCVEACLQGSAAGHAAQPRAWLLLAAARDQEGAAEQALHAAEQAATLARAVGDMAAEAEAVCLRAATSHRLGLVHDSIESTATALSLARRAGSPRVEGMALRQMSNQALRGGDEDEARSLLEHSLVCSRAAGDDSGEFWSLNNISNLQGLQAARLAEAGEREAARAVVAELREVVTLALQVAERTGHWLHRAFAVANLADAYIVEGDHAQARALVQAYAGIAREGGSQRLLAYANLDEVRMLRAEGRADAAVAVIDCDAHRQLLPGNDDIAQATETALYELHKAAGRFEAALRHHENASRMDAERLARKADRQVSVMLARMDAEQARAAAERAHLDAELSARRAQVLELERERLQRAAHEDALTGIGNRRAADAALAQHLQRAAAGAGLCVAVVDIDRFKRINDTHGHAVGDAVLAALGALMRNSLRSRDQVFRHGGEEFLVLLADATPETGLEACERLRLAIQQHDWNCIAPGLAVTASIGLARSEAAEGAHALLRRADQALYGAKHAGRNRVACA